MGLTIEAAIHGFADRLGNSVAVCTLDLFVWELGGEYYYKILALICIAAFSGLEKHISYTKLGLVAPLAYYLIPSPGGILFIRAIHSAITLQGLPYDQTPKIVYLALVSIPYIITGFLTTNIAAIFSWIIPNYWYRVAILFVPNVGESITILSAITRYVAPAVGFGLPTCDPDMVLRIIGSGLVAVVMAIGGLIILLIQASGFVCRALMRISRSGTLLFLDNLDQARLQRTWTLIQRELTRRETNTEKTRQNVNEHLPNSNLTPPPKHPEDPIYTEIKRDDQKFRVLRILPGTSPLLECHLTVVSLLDDSTENSYEAISYRWRFSAKLPVFPILINGHNFGVQSNVYRLLRDVRLPSQDRYIWIDSICVNQGDEHDCGVQIPLMHEIYSKARRVVSWFADSREGMGGITALKRVLRNGQPNSADLWFIINSPFSFQLVRWIKIVEFLRHDYFTRMWMIQEIALSKKLTMIHGKEEIDWSEFATILPSLHGPEGERFLREPGFYGQWYLDQRVTNGIKGALSMHVARDLLSCRDLEAQELLAFPKPLYLLYKRINTPLSGRRLRRLPLSAIGALAHLLSLPDIQSTVPEDKIHGIGGLLELRAQEPVVYGKDVISTSNILRDFASKLLREDETTFPSYFYMAGLGYKELASPISSPKWTDKTPKFLNLPSWVPDIHQPRSKNPGIDGMYLAGTAERKRVSAVSGAPNLLKISMSRISTIDTVTDSAFVFPDPPDTDMCFYRLRTFIANAQHLAQLSRLHNPPFTRPLPSPYPSPREAFTRTLFGDITAGTLPPIPLEILENLETSLNLLLRNPSDENSLHEILFELGRSLLNHRFCVTTSGHFGLVPLGCRQGDEVFIVWGAQTPFVLRRVVEEERVKGVTQGNLGGEEGSKEEQWVILGSCYLHGFMREEASRADRGDMDVIVK